MKTSSTVVNVSDHNRSMGGFRKSYFKNRSKSPSNINEKKESKIKPSAMKRYFGKWRSFWKLKGCSETYKENVVEPGFSNDIKRDPPKSLPLIRRCDHFNYGPLIHETKDVPFLESKLFIDKSVDSIDDSSFVPPPPLPLRQSLFPVNNNIEFSAMKRTTKSNNLIDNFRQLKQVPWYWGPLTKYDAELLLQNKENGVFLVRDSGHEAYVLSVSFRAGHRTYHTRVEHSFGKFSFWLNDRNAVRAANIVDFIKQLIEESKSGHVRYLISDSGHSGDQIGDGPNISVALLTPLSRLQTVQSLAHLSRFQILLRIRRDHIGLLPIPKFLKTYLQSSQYFVERIEDFL